MSENSPRPNTRAQDQSLARGALGVQQLFADSPVGILSPYRLGKLRAQKLRFDDDFKSPGADKPKENFAVTTPSVPQDAKEYTSEDVPLLVQLLADKQKLIESMQAALADNEQQMLRLRSLRRGVNSPAGLTESGRKERTRKPKDRLMEVEGDATPRTPLAEMAVDSPMLPVAPSYISDLVSQIERLQIEKMELNRTILPAGSAPQKSPSKRKRREAPAKEQLRIASAENESSNEQLNASATEVELLRSQVDMAANETESLRTRVEASSVEVESLKSRLHDVTKEVASLKEERDEITRQNKSLIAQLADSAAELDLTKTRLDVAVKENAELKMEAEKERSERKNGVDARETANDVSLKEQLKAAMIVNLEMKEEILQLNMTLSNRGTDSEKRMKELEYEVEELRAALKAATLLEFEVEALRATLKAAAQEKDDLEELRSTNAQLTERVNQLTHSVRAGELQMAMLDEEWLKRLREVMLENQQLRQKLVVMETKDSQIADLENENILSQAERNKYEKLYSGTLAQLDESNAMCETLSEQNALLESKLKELDSQFKKYKTRAPQQKAVDDAKSAGPARAPNCSSEQWLRPIARSVQLLQGEKRAVVSQVTSLQRKVEEDMHDIMAKVDQVVQNLMFTNINLINKYQHEMALRKKLHNELVELKGNIRVICRIRPVIKADRIDAGRRVVVCCDQYDDTCVTVDHKDRKIKYDCDRVFDQKSTQQEVFDEVKALTVSCIDGFNVCIFAYGQTGSGKTYTMEGVAEDPGLNQRALQELFREMESRRPDWTFTVFVSVVEIYQETLRDLLSDGSSKVERLKVMMTAIGGLEVPGLTSAQVESVEDINEVATIAHQNRTTAMTKMNERSSRSHALLCVNVEGTNSVTGAKTIGKLNLVDLAGSERVHKSGAEGLRLKEARGINRSLSALGDVINALRNKQQHIPYRNSKLTYLLQNSLGGNSKTLMIVQVAPVDDHVSETIASLSFAQRIRSVEIGQATKKTVGAEVGQGTKGTVGADVGQATKRKGGVVMGQVTKTRAGHSKERPFLKSDR